MITCEQLSALLGAYAAGELPAADRARVDQHLDLCPACSAEAAGYFAVIRLAQTLPPADLPPDADRRLRTLLTEAASETDKANQDPNPTRSPDDTQPETPLP